MGQLDCFLQCNLADIVIFKRGVFGAIITCAGDYWAIFAYIHLDYIPRGGVFAEFPLVFFTITAFTWREWLDFIGEDSVCLILGDNIFYGLDFSKQLEAVVQRNQLGAKATIFGYTVKDPHRYGVIEFDAQGNALSIEEKPENPKSNQAVVGLYFYPNEVVKVAQTIKPSARGELEITAINQYFLAHQKLKVEALGRGVAWLDTGTHESLLTASQFIETIEKRTGLKIGCLEEIAYQKGYISQDKLLEQAQKLRGTSYGDYLLKKYTH